MRVLAPAKLNLTLHITGKRADGYHLLDSLTAFTEFGDVLTFSPSETLSLTVEGAFAEAAGAVADNLVMRAAQALKAASGYAGGAHIRLEKHIPAGAGLGGGSSDAAATLLALNRLWRLALPDVALTAVAENLGSDVPACLGARPVRMRGAGELLEPAYVPHGLWALLASPGAPVATAAVYKAFAGPFSLPVSPPVSGCDQAAFIRWLAPLHNDLQPAAISLMPSIAAVLRLLETSESCLLARMSGSGSACFGLYGGEDAARRAEAQVRGALPGAWSVVTRLRGAHETQ